MDDSRLTRKNIEELKGVAFAKLSEKTKKRKLLAEFIHMLTPTELLRLLDETNKKEKTESWILRLFSGREKN
ncbi:MAG: hypothetical protein JW812_03210 [Alphaproteobacteria bacterium]|nr:hypothetical protein [Alphaproteobacteria bacterium]MBN2779853.1 hypothetical protein [Alphaproteobacteria bacterium]